MNYAELEQYISDNPDLETCKKNGSTHAAYGWSPSPWGHWTKEQKDAYNEGHQAERARQRQGGA